MSLFSSLVLLSLVCGVGVSFSGLCVGSPLCSWLIKLCLAAFLLNEICAKARSLKCLVAR